jgi:hypothetical protein
MRLIYHPDAEAELIQAARFYESRVSTLGSEFLDAADRAIAVIVEAPDRWSIIEADVRRYLMLRFPRFHSYSCVQASQSAPRLLALPTPGLARKRLTG